jgi:hypothetical protein
MKQLAEHVLDLFIQDSTRCPLHSPRVDPKLYSTRTYRTTVEEHTAARQVYIDCPTCVTSFRCTDVGCSECWA